METRGRKRTRSIHCMRIEKVVGSGTFGVVYKAVDKSSADDPMVALKKIKMERETQGFPVTAIREIKILNLMRNHRNIVQLREIVTHEGGEKDTDDTVLEEKFSEGDVFMVFEFVDYDLSGLLKAKPDLFNNRDRVKSYLRQLLDGVSFLHSKNILHRDIKSANLLVTKGNVLKIADWGLARTIPEGGVSRLTNPVVTLWYRSPEVIVGSRQYGRGVDTWSVGCIFGEMVLKVAPFRAENREAAQLELIFRTTGSPKGPTLSAVYEPLEQWRNFEASRKTYERNFIAKFPESQMTHSGLDLLEQLLDLDPNTRISADHALEHSYFSDWKQPEELPEIDIAPVTEWMENERRKILHQEQQQQQQLHASKMAAAARAETSGHGRGGGGRGGRVGRDAGGGGGVQNAGYFKTQQTAGSEVKGKFKILRKGKIPSSQPSQQQQHQAGNSGGTGGGAAATGSSSSSNRPTASNSGKGPA